MRKLVRDPLTHFLVVGVLLYFALQGRGGPVPASEVEIRVSAGQLQHLASSYERTWKRAPTRSELEGLVADHVRQEAAYREGVSMGLDANDVIIRRRIRQKLEFLAQELAFAAAPSDEDLAAFLSEHPERFRTPVSFDLRQIFLGDPGSDPAEPDADELQQMLERLNADPGGDARDLGQRTMLNHAFSGLTVPVLQNRFGPSFARAVEALEAGVWSGPLSSGFGAHLVIVDARRGGLLPSLEEIREDVVVEWKSDQQDRATEAFYEAMLEKYSVHVEWPEESAAPAEAGEGS